VAAGDCGLIAAGGSASISASVAAAGTEAATDAAIDYSILYGTGSVIDVSKNNEQISKSGDWRAFGLIAGYSAFAAVQAGLQSDFTEGKLDKWLFGEKYSKGMLGGVLPDAVGGAIHGSGDWALGGYHYNESKWHGDWSVVRDQGLYGAAQAGINKFVGNGFDKVARMSRDQTLAKYALMLPKEVAGLGLTHDFGSVEVGSNISVSWVRDYWKLLKDF
jgi:hypothetical protein